jgi:cysteinyl-tRNA synthetase
MVLKLYNSLSRQLEEFRPINPPKVGMYTCGPTVYDFVTIGNWRTYLLSDILLRTLQYLGYQVNYFMNITDVGHLTGDNLGDADIGEDRMEKAAKRENRTAWDIAKFYIDDFLKGYESLNLIKPSQFTRATDHIKEQIELVQKIESKGFSYKITDGIYFDVGKWEKKGNKYGELSNLDQIKPGARVEVNHEKKDQHDFALWKFTPEGVARQMEWDSPWGKGFPGWHIECSAMSIKYLGEQFDIHVGGEDLKSTHHPNEIVQSEAATGKKPFVKYWIHGAFLQVNGGRMGKSLGNAYNLQDIINKGFNPKALRYFYLTGHYLKPLNFTWEALTSSQQSLERLYQHMQTWFNNRTEDSNLSEEKNQKIDKLRQQFNEALTNDLAMPNVLEIVWQAVKSNLSDYDKYDLLLDWDQVLGLDLNKVSELPKISEVSEEVRKLINEREHLRQANRWEEADKIRKQIEAEGYVIEDTEKGTVVKIKSIIK